MMDTGFEDLEPEGGSLLQKFSGNYLLGANREGLFNVALRIARVNHACQPNAAVIYDETARVAVLFAQKDIHPGQEICMCYYTPFFSLLPIPSSNMYPGMNPEWNIEEELNFIKDEALSTYGITCPADCSCNDPIIWNLVQEGRQLHKTIKTLANQLEMTEEVLAAGDKLLDIHRRLNVSWIYRGFTEHILFLQAIRESVTLPRAKEYIRSAVELFRNICPYSEKLTKTYEKLMEHPEAHPNFMMMD